MAGERKSPIWKRLGFSSEYAYRNHRAKEAGFKSYAEQRRVLSVQATGLTPSQRRTIRRRVPVGPLPQAQARARQTASETRAKRKSDVEWMHLENIAYAENYGGPAMLERSRTFPKRGREYNSRKQLRRIERADLASTIRVYNIPLALAQPDYVVDYYNSFVNPDSNYEHWMELRKEGKGYYEHGGRAKINEGFRAMNFRWGPQLPGVVGLLSQKEWDARYGHRLF